MQLRRCVTVHGLSGGYAEGTTGSGCVVSRIYERYYCVLLCVACILMKFEGLIPNVDAIEICGAKFDVIRGN